MLKLGGDFESCRLFSRRFLSRRVEQIGDLEGQLGGQLGSSVRIFGVGVASRVLDFLSQPVVLHAGVGSVF
ncbi:hypothetical protein [Deinococcus sp.]|uniref:hypothetical protein n=1 Tax=Deinococcus sp. TaxID=47478 RepID=UPI003B5B6616